MIDKYIAKFMRFFVFNDQNFSTNLNVFSLPLSLTSVTQPSHFLYSQ